jgi:AcrR family transcriptional regulator
LPTPAKTSPPELVEIARQLLDASGVEFLSVSAVAQRAGVKAPSLYKHFADRAALLRAVELSILADLEASLRAGMRGATPKARLHALGHAYRAFATTHPQRYALLYRQDAMVDPQVAAAAAVAAEPMFEQLKACGLEERRVLPLARMLTAFMHGFVSMEIARAFRFGGSIDEAFEDGLSTILTAIG